MPPAVAPWKVLLVDDDSAVLRLGELLLNSVTFEGRSVVVLLASSGEEAKQVILANPDLAVAIVDVIMETNTAGLDLTDWIAQQSTHKATRVVIHSGQPAELRQDAVERNYEIHDYWHKSAIGASAMRTRLLFLLRSHRDILKYQPPGASPSVEDRQGLWTLSYASTWSGTPSREAFQALAAQSKERNSAQSISGVLLVDGVRILQILEGERATVEELFGRIEADPRHRGVSVLHSGAVGSRSFPNWAMRTITSLDPASTMSTPLLESIRAYAAGHRPSPANFAQLLLSLTGRVSSTN